MALNDMQNMLVNTFGALRFEGAESQDRVNHVPLPQLGQIFGPLYREDFIGSLKPLKRCIFSFSIKALGLAFSLARRTAPLKDNSQTFGSYCRAAFGKCYVLCEPRFNSFFMSEEAFFNDELYKVWWVL